jgi:hypothetical protein
MEKKSAYANPREASMGAAVAAAEVEEDAAGSGALPSSTGAIMARSISDEFLLKNPGVYGS